MKVIGLTGGIGSGKSRVAAVLAEYFNAEVINTDQIAKEQMKKGHVSYNAVVDEFGTEILDVDLQIDRVKLSRLVFREKEKLERLDALTHPNVLAWIEGRRKLLVSEGFQGLLVIETALLIEAGYDSFCDEIWYVYASEAEREQRLILSRGYTSEKVKLIFASQKTEKEFSSHCTVRIEHGDKVSLSDLLSQIKTLLSVK